MDLIAEIRRRRLVSKESVRSIARDLNLSRPAVRKHCRSQCEPLYHRHKQPMPMLSGFQETLETWLRVERHLPKAQRRTPGPPPGPMCLCRFYPARSVSSVEAMSMSSSVGSCRPSRWRISA